VSSPRVTPVVVRVADERDLQHPDVGGPAGEYRPQLSAVMHASSGVVLVAELDGEIVGRITVTTAARQADISGFIVAEARRRQGLGTALIEAAESEARRRGCTQLRLTVAKENAGAFALYIGRGYERVGEGRSAGLRTREGIEVHAPEPVWRMIKPVS
jgi:ribosomal protein S18 acetylase RimI-like enzyme